jgi:hypothetical protein
MLGRMLKTVPISSSSTSGDTFGLWMVELESKTQHNSGEGMMKPKKSRLSLLLGTTAALAAPSSVTIFEAQLNSAQTLLTITGRSFTKRSHVSLGTDNITSLCRLGNTTGTPITCMFVLPDFPSGLPPGEYRILVLDPGAGVSDVFDLTTVGPAGPAGPKGVAGPSGPQGPIGSQMLRSPWSPRSPGTSRPGWGHWPYRTGWSHGNILPRASALLCKV